MKSLSEFLSQALPGTGPVVVLTGAGVSAESGIPTFRGKEGYWTVGSRQYRPMELATHGAFAADPEVVWPWYLYRRGICRQAEPNPGHRALVEMDKHLGDAFRLVTQNVDGLHVRAGNPWERTWHIHGNLDFVRCDRSCGFGIQPFPDHLPDPEEETALTAEQRQALTCPDCDSWLRPHVLWFDECYDEEHFFFESSLGAVAEARLLVVAGTSGATNLPMQMGMLAAQARVPLIDINPEINPFAELAQQTGGLWLQGPSGTWLPRIADELQTLF